jgi:hypothetical protein
MWQPPHADIDIPTPFFVGSHRRAPNEPSDSGTAFCCCRYAALLICEMNEGSKLVSCGVVASSNTRWPASVQSASVFNSARSISGFGPTRWSISQYPAGSRPGR